MKENCTEPKQKKTYEIKENNQPDTTNNVGTQRRDFIRFLMFNSVQTYHTRVHSHALMMVKQITKKRKKLKNQQ